MSIGFVYILVHEFMPNVYKIGCTERSPHTRAEELSRSTSVPSSFDVLCYLECRDFLQVEQAAHRYMSANRINENREFFQDDIDKAISYLYHHPSRLSFCIVNAFPVEGADHSLIHVAGQLDGEVYVDRLPNPWTQKREEAKDIEVGPEAAKVIEAAKSNREFE